MTRTDIVVGGQFGSEAKGHIASILTKSNSYPGSVCIRVGGPNAGHTVYDDAGNKFAFRSLPVAAVNSDMDLYIGPGSEIDLNVLAKEIRWAKTAGHTIKGRLYVSDQATIITEVHKDREIQAQLTANIGSTAKGIGAARAERLMRTAPIADKSAIRRELANMGARVVTRDEWMPPSGPVAHVIEGTQGYGLGLHAGFYPFCTAGDCRNIDFLAQSGLSLAGAINTWVVFRTFPIRVAGNSGPLRQELTWQELSGIVGRDLTPEKTTVTQKVRRIGMWDSELALKALTDNGYSTVGQGQRVRPVLTFLDYLDPSLEGCWSMDQIRESPAWRWIEAREDELQAKFHLFTTGPKSYVWRDQL